MVKDPTEAIYTAIEQLNQLRHDIYAHYGPNTPTHLPIVWSGLSAVMDDLRVAVGAMPLYQKNIHNPNE